VLAATGSPRSSAGWHSCSRHGHSVGLCRGQGAGDRDTAGRQGCRVGRNPVARQRLLRSPIRMAGSIGAPDSLVGVDVTAGGSAVPGPASPSEARHACDRAARRSPAGPPDASAKCWDKRDASHPQLPAMNPDSASSGHYVRHDAGTARDAWRQHGGRCAGGGDGIAARHDPRAEDPPLPCHGLAGAPVQPRGCGRRRDRPAGRRADRARHAHRAGLPGRRMGGHHPALPLRQRLWWNLDLSRRQLDAIWRSGVERGLRRHPRRARP